MQKKSIPIRSYAKRYQISPIPAKSINFAPKIPISSLLESKTSQSRANGSPKLKPLLNMIEAKSQDYEDAIKSHLGIQHLSRDSSFSSILKKIQKPKKRILGKSLDVRDIRTIEIEEAKLWESIKHLDSSKQRIMKKKSKSIRSIKTIDEKDKEIQVLQNSLNQINLMLNKLLRRSPTRLK